MAEETSIDDIKQLEDRIKQLEEERQRWVDFAGKNQLTGLPNSLIFRQVALPKELSRGLQKPISLAGLLLCPDGLTQINQQHGRIVGDQLIKQVSHFLKQQIQPGEQLFHWDGANFSILMPGTAMGGARRRASLIKDEYAKATFSVGNEALTGLTCSVGFAEIEGEIKKVQITEYANKFYHDLCNRLYKAKEYGGKDRKPLRKNNDPRKAKIR